MTMKRTPAAPPAVPESRAPLNGYGWHLFVVLMLLVFGVSLWHGLSAPAPVAQVDYSQFYTWVQAGDVESVEFSGQTLRGTLGRARELGGQSAERFSTVLPGDDPALLPLLRQQGVAIRVSNPAPSLAVEVVAGLLPWLLIIGVWVWISRRTQRTFSSGSSPFGNVLKSKSKKFDKQRAVEVRFEEVAGLESAKRDLQEIVQFLKEPARFRRLGGKVPRGVLLVGPPGTGKTLLARAVAGEAGVPFYSISASEFIEMFVGVGAARVRQLFEEAKKNAPAIVFIDEIDAVGRSRGTGLGGGHDEREQTLNQLLSEMDGFDRNDLTIVLAATNRPDVLDPALLRPGRFDRRVVVDRPELNAREAILKVHTKGKPLGADVDLRALAQSTPGFSGADLANLVNEAALSATRAGADSIVRRDFAAAYDKIVLGDPREGRLDAREKARVAVHEAGHAVVAYYSTECEPLARVSILPRGMTLGVTQQTPAADRHLMTEPELRARLRVLMGGHSAERLLLGSASSGAENDLKEATRIASKMVANYGMSKSLGPAYYEHQSEHPFLGQRIGTDAGASAATLSAIECEARDCLTAAAAEARELLTLHRGALERLVEALLERETLEERDLVGLLEPKLALAAE